MANKHHIWGSTQLPKIEPHSKIKLEILRNYIKDYIKIYAKRPTVEDLPISFVDGFCGGGMYKDAVNGECIFGSPFVILQAVREAEAEINQQREKIKFKVHANYYFIDKDENAIDSLKNHINNSNFADLIKKNHIHFINKEFNHVASDLVTKIKDGKSRNSRAIFFLDQYGYLEINTTSVNVILNNLPMAELILNFHIESLLRYFNEKNFINFCKKTQFIQKEKVDLNELYQNLWCSEQGHSRSAITQKYIFDSITRLSGSGFHEAFFIKNSSGVGKYWLIHMSRISRAKDAMNSIAWGFANHMENDFMSVFQAADGGLDRFNMLGYSPKHDPSLVGQSLFSFDSFAKELNVNILHEQIPKMLREKFAEGTTVKNFYEKTCNHTSASKEQYLKVISSLIKSNDIDLFDEEGKRLNKRQAQENFTIKDSGQTQLIYLP